MKVKIERLTMTLEGSIEIQMDTPSTTVLSNQTDDNNAASNPTDGTNQSTPTANNGKCEEKDDKVTDQGKVAEEKEDCKIAESNKTECSNERKMTREEELMELRKHVQNIQDALRTAKDTKDIDEALSSLDGLLKDIEYDPTLGTFVRNLSGDANALRMHDITRAELDRSLQTLLKAIDRAVEQEKDQERIKKMEQFFLGMAKNAEAIYEAIKESGNGDDFLKIF